MLAKALAEELRAEGCCGSCPCCADSRCGCCAWGGTYSRGRW